MLARRGALQRFGLITTNSIRQAFNRRIIEAAMAAPSAKAVAFPPSPAGRGDGGEGPAKRVTSRADVPSSGASRHLLPGGEGKEQALSLVFAIPDHPWVDVADGAAVRIAMTVAEPGKSDGFLAQVIAEREHGEEVDVELSKRSGLIHADLRTGANVAAARALQANLGLSCPGFKLHGAGFIVTPSVAEQLGLGRVPGLDAHIRPYRNGRDLTGTPRGVLVIDLYGLDADAVLARFPAVYQHLLDHVKPERDAKAHTKDGAAYAKTWWLHGKTRSSFRPALSGLPRYIVTVETAKHRVFQLLDAEVAPDNMLIAIAIEDTFALGVLSSEVHVAWALAAGGRLGVGNDPRYNKSRCFDPFPFPEVGEDLGKV